MGLFSKKGYKGDGKQGKKAEGKKGKPADKAKDEKPKDEAPADPEVAELKALFTKPPDPPGNHPAAATTVVPADAVAGKPTATSPPAKQLTWDEACREGANALVARVIASVTTATSIS